MYSLFPLATSFRLQQGTSTISNQPVAGSIIVMQVRLTYLFMIEPPGSCFIIDLEYGPIRSIYAELQGFNAAIVLTGRCT